nr:CotH kinase family protein [uncultured Marinifilum sp.]
MRIFLLLSFLIIFQHAFSQIDTKQEIIPPGNEIFNADTVHEIRINFLQCSVWDSLVHIKKERDSLQIKRHLQGNVELNGKMYYSCGLRFKGESSYDFYPGLKKSFKINFGKFIKKQRWNGIKTINLNNAFKDPTFMREKLFLDFMRSEGLKVPRCTYANVYLNGKLLGLYLLVEEINKGFLERNFGNKKGSFFKGEPKAYLKYEGDSIDTYRRSYQNKKDSSEGYQDLIEFIRTIDNKGDLSSIFNVEDCLKIFAITSLFVNVDAYNIMFRHNYYLYKNMLNDKFEWIPYDANYAFCAFSRELNLKQAENLSIFYKMDNNEAPLMDLLFGNKKYRDFYTEYLKGLTAKNRVENYVESKVDSLSLKIRKYIYYDTNKMYTNADFEVNLNKVIGDVNDPGAFIPGLKPFIHKRIKAVKKELKLKKEQRD